ncbi:hypothetical protein SAMN05216241_101371 [Limimonas halophila]|uniref:Uncharacterized protein n=1 Tax=Limimonas halophila TaxID=1082479 RepID=A0A1G7LTF4_9PROT|nr:hypothetical protein SAMN05216241_101371 [Limimonas halophila]
MRARADGLGPSASPSPTENAAQRAAKVREPPRKGLSHRNGMQALPRHRASTFRRHDDGHASRPPPRAAGVGAVGVEEGSGMPPHRAGENQRENDLCFLGPGPRGGAAQGAGTAEGEQPPNGHGAGIISRPVRVRARDACDQGGANLPVVDVQRDQIRVHRTGIRLAAPRVPNRRCGIEQGHQDCSRAVARRAKRRSTATDRFSTATSAPRDVFRIRQMPLGRRVRRSCAANRLGRLGEPYRRAAGHSVPRRRCVTRTGLCGCPQRWRSIWAPRSTKGIPRIFKSLRKNAAAGPNASLCLLRV